MAKSAGNYDPNESPEAKAARLAKVERFVAECNGPTACELQYAGYKERIESCDSPPTTAHTEDGPLGGFATVGREAAELDLMLTEFQIEVEAAADEETPPEEQTFHAAMALDLKRNLIDRYTPSATPRAEIISDITDISDSQQADETGVDRLAVAMKAKLAAKRAEGRGGWNHEPYTVQPDRGDRVQRFGCTIAELRGMFLDHISKGDMLDVANFAMMIWNREHPEGESARPVDITPKGIS